MLRNNVVAFFCFEKKETLFKFSTASKGVKISRHLFWSTGQWSVLQNKCLDIFLPRYPVLHINKVTFFIADALEKCGSNYFGALTIDQCSKIIMYTKFWPCSQRKRNLYVYIYIYIYIHTHTFFFLHLRIVGGCGKCRQFPKMFRTPIFAVKTSFF